MGLSSSKKKHHESHNDYSNAFEEFSQLYHSQNTDNQIAERSLTSTENVTHTAVFKNKADKESEGKLSIESNLSWDIIQPMDNPIVFISNVPEDIRVVVSDDFVIVELVGPPSLLLVDERFYSAESSDYLDADTDENQHTKQTPNPSVSIPGSTSQGNENEVPIKELQHTLDNRQYLRPSHSVSMESLRSSASSSSATASYLSDLYDDNYPFRIQTYLKYQLREWVLTAGVKKADCPHNKKYKDRRIYWQVHLTLLPLRKQRFKTKYRSTGTPIFSETFQFQDISKDALSQLSVRFRLYGRFRRTSRKILLGEVEVEVGNLYHTLNNLKDGDWWTLNRITSL